MGKPTGFMEYDRQLPSDRPEGERIRDWNEFHTHMDIQKLREQGARCMNCGVPFCHTGKTIGGAAMGCPLNNLIPEWNDLVWRGEYEEAYRRLSLTNHFPEFTGRVCPAPCEGSCTLGMHDPAVTIKSIERHIIDTMFERGLVKARMPKKSTGKRVAVVGSGPAGLACADMLNQMGYCVTVFERADRPGGLLMYGIPNMKLEKNVVLRRAGRMKKEGVVFRFGTEIGRDYPASQLLRDYDAAVLCIGAAAPRPPAAEGAQLKGVYYAVDFLSRNTKSLLDSNFEDRQFVDVRDKRVVIIGGGDTGTDCVGTSIRHGCRSVVQLEIMPEPPSVRSADNPWPEWPRVKKTDYGQEEAAHVFGSDPREYETTVTKIEDDGDGRVRRVHTVRVQWVKDEMGRVSPKPVKGTEQVRGADVVLLAMGFLGPEQELPRQLGLNTTERSNIDADDTQYQTNIPGVFAAGDCRRGQSLVVWGIREGCRAAEAVDNYLKGH